MAASAFARVPVLGLAVVSIACAGSAKREAASLLFAVDRYRHTSAPADAVQVTAVTNVACTDAEVCAAKGACVEAIAPTVQALALKDEVGHRLADIEAARLAPDSPEAQELPVKLDLATHLLNRGRAKMGDCDKRLSDLQVRYGL